MRRPQASSRRACTPTCSRGDEAVVNAHADAPVEVRRDVALLELACALRDSGYRFVTVTPATHARVNARPGNAWARSVEDVFGWSRPFRAGVLPAGWLERMREADVLRPHEDGWRSTIRASTLACAGDALFLHSAFPTTMADAVFFGPDTYRYAGAIVDLLADGAPVRRAVDIGCGAGPGALTVAHARPSATVFAVDINDEALRHTRVNAALANKSRFEVMKGFFEGVGHAASAGIWEEVPKDNILFRDEYKRRLEKDAKKRKAEEMI